MKPFIHIACISVVLLGLVRRVDAVPPTIRVRSGVVKSVDHGSTRFTVLTDDSILRSVAWTRRTTFWKEGKEVTAAAFRSGDYIKLSYRSPIFGPVSAVKLRVLSSGKETASANSRR